MNRENDISIESLYFEITNICNYSCAYCYNCSASMNSTYLNKDKIFKLINTVLPRGLTAVTYSGGEPFLYPGLREIIQHSEALHLRKHIITNGSMLTPEWCEFLQDKDFTIQLTLDSHIPEVQDKARKEGAFRDTITAIKLLGKYGLLQNLFLRCNLSFYNYSCLQSYVDFISELGVKKVQFSLITDSGRDEGHKCIHKVTNQPVINEIQRIVKELNYRNVASITLANHDITLSCPLIKMENPARLRITSSGDVYPCQLLEGQQFLLGNIYSDDFEINSLSIALQRCAELLHKRLYADDLNCSSCAHSNLCQGGCAAENIKFSESAFLPEYCSLRKKICWKEIHDKVV